MAGQAVPVELQPVMSGLTNRLYLTGARDGSVRLFVVEQAGVIKVLAPPRGTLTGFLDIRNRLLARAVALPHPALPTPHPDPAVPTAPGVSAPYVGLTGPKEGATAPAGRSCCLSSNFNRVGPRAEDPAVAAAARGDMTEST